jgi:hypothetical protein
MNKIVFETYWYNGRKYAKINGEKILMEPSVQDRVKDLCKQCFKKFRIQFQYADKPSFLLTVEHNTDTSLFEERVTLLFNDKVYYDIIRTKFK